MKSYNKSRDLGFNQEVEESKRSLFQSRPFTVETPPPIQPKPYLSSQSSQQQDSAIEQSPGELGGDLIAQYMRRTQSRQRQSSVEPGVESPGLASAIQLSSEPETAAAGTVIQMRGKKGRKGRRKRKRKSPQTQTREAPVLEQEDEEDEDEDEEVGESIWEVEKDLLEDEEEEEEDEDEDQRSVLEKILDLPKNIQIELETPEKSTDTSYGKLSGQGGVKKGLESTGVSGKTSLKGDYGKAEAEGEINRTSEGVEGEAKISAEYGLGGNRQKKGDWSYWGGEVSGKAAIEGFVGVKAGAETKGKFTTETWKAKGKASAFAGGSLETKVGIDLKVAGQAVAQVKGTLGVTYGLGGELTGSITWDGGGIAFAAKGKVAAGAGATFGLDFRLNPAGFGTKLLNWLKSWGSWATSWLW